MGKIIYPKNEKIKVVNFNTANDVQHQSNNFEQIDLQLDELKTNALMQTQKASVLAESQGENASDISTLQTTVGTHTSQISQFNNSISALQNTVATHTSQISALSSNKQNNLTAGNGIDISNNTVSVDTTTIATKTDLASKQDVLTFDNSPTRYSNNPVKSAGVFDALALKQDVILFDTVPRENSTSPITSGGVYNALQNVGSNITIDSTPIQNSQNAVSSGGVYTALQNIGGSCDCATDIANLQGNISDILNKIAVLNTKINDLSTEYQETIYKEYDVYEREFDITKSNSLTTPSVLFSTEAGLTTLDENEEVITHTVKVINNVELRLTFDTAGTYNYVVYDSNISLKTGTIEVANNEINTEKTVAIKITNYTSKADHNYYITITGSNRNVTLKNVKMLIMAPNVCVLNKIPAIDVDYNYHTGKYYFSNCSTGTAKVCEISPNDLHSTTDIVWTDTGIPAQNYKVYYIGLTNNTSTDLGKKYAIITQKNNTVRILDLDTNQTLYTFDEGTYKVEKVCTKRDYSMLYMTKVVGNQIDSRYCLLYQNGSITLNNITNSANIIDINTIRNYNNYLINDSSYFGFGVIYKNTNICYYYNQTSRSQNEYKYVNKINLYMHRVVDGNNFEYDMYLKIFDTFYHTFITNYNMTMIFSQLQEIGEYDNYFPGANNDYFIVQNNILTYTKNT